ncbi:MAG: hypothetical protein WKF95_10365, partial [Rubrobacter sp.]
IEYLCHAFIMPSTTRNSITTLLSVVVSTLSVLIILLAPAAVPLTILLRAGYLYPNAASYGNLWHLFALALMIALLAWSHRRV